MLWPLLLPSLAPSQKPAATVPTIPGYKLVWHDEFNGTGLPDPAKWNYEVGKIRNKEAEYYTHARIQNAFQKNGFLTIRAIHEPYKGCDFTSTSLITLGKFSFQYGKVEVSAKLPGGSGSWPAIWMMGADRDIVKWPRCGELDIMEHVAFQPSMIFGTMHEPKPDGTPLYSKGGKISVPDCTTAFHTYGMDWSPQAISFTFDGKPYFTYPYSGPQSWVFDRPMYLILNLAVGGTWGGEKGLDPSVYPQDYKIDWVRIWQKSKP